MKDVSSLMDGELDAGTARSTIQRVEDQDELWDAWSTFHLIRDTLQGNPVVPGRLNQRLHERLLHEPVPVPLPWWKRTVGSRRARTGAMIAAAALLALPALLLLQPGSRTPAPTAFGTAASEALAEPRLVERIAAHRPMLPPEPVPAPGGAREAGGRP
jgi:negative regulator of sigma E activity